MVSYDNKDKLGYIQAKNTDIYTLDNGQSRSIATSGIKTANRTTSIHFKPNSAKEIIREKLTARVTPMTRENNDNFRKKLFQEKKSSNIADSSTSPKPGPSISPGILSDTPIKVKNEFNGHTTCTEKTHSSGKKRNYTEESLPSIPPKKFLQSHPHDHMQASSTKYTEFSAGPQPFNPPAFVPGMIGINPMMSLLTASQGHLATLQDEDGDTPLHIAIAQGQVHLVQYLTQITLASGISLDIYNQLKQTPLHLAVITNQPLIIRTLINAGVDPNIPDRNGQTSVHLACQRSSIECLMELANSRHPINFIAKNYNGLTPLHEAVMSNSGEIIRFLIVSGADADCKDGKSGHTPLHYAVEQEDTTIIKLLIDLGANVNATSYAGITPIQAASGRGIYNITKLLSNCNNESTKRGSYNKNTSTYGDKTKRTPRK